MNLGFSYYAGALIIDNMQDHGIIDFDAEYKINDMIIRGEYIQADQQTSGADLTKHGFYAEAAYRINRFFEHVFLNMIELT